MHASLFSSAGSNRVLSVGEGIVVPRLLRDVENAGYQFPDPAWQLAGDVNPLLGVLALSMLWVLNMTVV